jgi:hypothetical protein
VNTKWVWRIVLVIIILELGFVTLFEMKMRYRESQMRTDPYIWYTTDQA